MTDLVDRLHADADAWDPHAPETAQLEREAAAEIERLTANLSHHIDAKAQLTLERDELRAEVERLTQENAAARSDIEMLIKSRDVLLQEVEELRSELLRHACHCGPTDPDPAVHREDCAYRIALLGDPPTSPAPQS